MHQDVAVLLLGIAMFLALAACIVWPLLPRRVRRRLGRPFRRRQGRSRRRHAAWVPSGSADGSFGGATAAGGGHGGAGADGDDNCD